MAGQTACPEEALARARNHCLLEKQMVVWGDGSDAAEESKFQISELWRLARKFESLIGGVMNSKADSCGRRKYQSSRNVLPNGGMNLGPGDAVSALSRIPEGVRASLAPPVGEYDVRRLRSQREIIRDVMLSAADCDSWLTLGELRALTQYGEASISAQLRHLRKTENGGYDVTKRHREGASSGHPGTDGRGEYVWEYRVTPGVRLDRVGSGELLEAVGA